MEEWNSACLSRCSVGLRPLVKLCVATRISGSLSCGAREVRSPCAWRGGRVTPAVCLSGWVEACCEMAGIVEDPRRTPLTKCWAGGHQGCYSRGCPELLAPKPTSGGHAHVVISHSQLSILRDYDGEELDVTWIGHGPTNYSWQVSSGIEHLQPRVPG